MTIRRLLVAVFANKPFAQRAPLEESRKWGIYFIVNLLFKTYFKLNSASLSRNILTSLKTFNGRGDMPPLEAFPKSQRVTFKFYEGVLYFLEENYIQVCATTLPYLLVVCRSLLTI